MIKDLIDELTFDKIDLNQALMRSKLIADEINNEDFKAWIYNELNGYSNDIKLPNYRLIPCEVFATIEGYGVKKMIPIDLTSLNKDLKDSIYKMEVKESVHLIEENLKKGGNEIYLYGQFPPQSVPLIREITGNRLITSLQKRFQFSQISQILNLTKQKLIDILLELNRSFPNLKNNFDNNRKNQEIANTIINNHIYGENASLNIGVGDNLTQTNSNTYNQNVEKLIAELEQNGVPKEDLEDVKEIVTTESNKTNLGKKLMSWVGKMATKAVEQGIDLEISKIIEKLNEFI